MKANLANLVPAKKLARVLKETQQKTSKLNAPLRITKVQGDQQIVTGEVYAPYVIDSHGEMMLPEDIVKLAHRTLLNSKHHSIDVMHDNKQIKASIVESYIAKANDPDYAEGAWVLSVKIMDDDVWAMVKAGKLNGYSLEAMVYKYEADVVYDYLGMHYGIVEENNGHFHSFIVKVDEEGRVIGGHTSEAEDENGVVHSHRIAAGTATRASNKHSHRYFLNEID